MHRDIPKFDESEYRDEVVQIGRGANSDDYTLIRILKSQRDKKKISALVSFQKTDNRATRMGANDDRRRPERTNQDGESPLYKSLCATVYEAIQGRAGKAFKVGNSIP